MWPPSFLMNKPRVSPWSSQARPIYRGWPSTGKRSCASGTCQRAPTGCQMTRWLAMATRQHGKTKQNAVGPQCNLEKRSLMSESFHSFLCGYLFLGDRDSKSMDSVQFKWTVERWCFLDSQFPACCKYRMCFPNWPLIFDGKKVGLPPFHGLFQRSVSRFRRLAFRGVFCRSTRP